MKVFPLQDITSGPDAPLISLDKFQKGSPEFSEKLGFFLIRDIVDLSPDRSSGRDMIVCNFNIRDIYPFQCADLYIF